MEFLKGILGDELYSQVESKVTAYNGDAQNKDKQIKIENINSGNYVSKDKYTTLQLEASGYKTQLGDANKEISSYKSMDIEGITQAAQTWETKYNDDIGKLNQTILNQQKEFAAKEYMGKQGFKSELAKEAAVSKLLAQPLEFKDGVFAGADDFIKKLKESDPESFIQETKEEPNPANWVRGTGNTHKPKAASDNEAYMKQKYGNNKYFKG